MPNRVTTLNPYKSGLEWTFEALPVPQIISWESSTKGPGSIAPMRAELWPFKEGTHQKRTKIGAKVPLFGNPFSNEHISGLEWSFAKIHS